jgi:hypothetical protein
MYEISREHIYTSQYTNVTYYGFNQTATMPVVWEGFATSNENLYEYMNKSSNYNIVFWTPLLLKNKSTSIIQNLSIFSKRELQPPVITILYLQSGTTELTDPTIGTVTYDLFKKRFNITTDFSIKSINLMAMIRQFMKGEQLNVPFDLTALLRHNYGFNFNFKFYHTTHDGFNVSEHLSLRIHDIFEPKPSLIKMMDQLHSIIDYNNHNRNRIISLIQKLTDGPLLLDKVKINISDILNVQKFVSITNDFDEINNISLDDNFTNFKEMVTNNTLITNAKITKILNIKGIQIKINNSIEIHPPKLVFRNLTREDIYELTYKLLKYYDKYDTFLKNISIVRLKSL